MSIVHVVMGLAVCGLAACGGSGGSPSPQPTTSPSPQPTSPQPSPTPSPTPQPSPSPTATDPGAAALQLERVDASAECDGLVPDRAPAVVTVAVAAPAGASCVGASADGTGHIAVGSRSGDAFTWTVFSSNGARSGEVSSPGLDELVREPDGWQGVFETPLNAPFESAELVRVTSDGAIGARTPLRPPDGYLVSDLRLAGDPSGGSAVAVAVTAIGGNHPSRTEAFRFGASGAPVHGDVNVMADSSPVVSFLGAGVSTAGDSIVSYRTPGAFVWRWIARSGALLALGSALQTDVRAADPVRLEPLLDGSVAIRFAGAWTAVVPHLGTTAVAAPEWLAARPGTLPRFTRGNRGYAVMPPRGEQLADCAEVVELRSPSGRLCGRVTVREGAGACTGRGLDQGWDGTLVQVSARDACTAQSCTCTVHAWPRLLAAP